ncbi:MAG: cation diffusion facilitator family transporter [Hyphomicrobiaceae bacterium]
MRSPTTEKHLGLIALASIGVALLTMGIKYIAYLKTGSIALYSDALESIVNVIAAVAAFAALRYSQRPADRNHPFGHHKAEYFSAVLEGVLIVIAALMILREAIPAFATPRVIDAPAIGLAISSLAMLLNGLWAALLVRVGTRMHSPALASDGHHLWSDVITSAGVLVGLGLALLTGWLVLDPLLASIVAVNILWTGWKVVRDSASGLLDRAVPADLQETIRSVITQSSAGALEFHDLRTRLAGPAAFIEFHMVVPGAMPVSTAHRICDSIEAALDDAVPGARVLIHIEPEGEAKHSGALVG